MPKITLESVENLPEEFQQAATKEGDKFVLDISLTSKVTEFRDHNVALRRDLEELKGFKQNVAQIYGVDEGKEFDLEDFRSNLTGLRELRSQVDAGKLIADTSLDEAVERRTSEMRGGYEKQKNELTKALDTEKKRAESIQSRMYDYVVGAELTRAVLAEDSDINPGALPDILNRAKGVFRVDPEKLSITPYGSDNQPLYGEDPTKAMSPTEWLKGLVKDAPYFSKSSTGGGAHNRTDGNGGVASQAGSMPMDQYYKQRKAELNQK